MYFRWLAGLSLGGLALLVPAAAEAQVWDRTLQLSADPVFGNEADAPFGDSIRDEAEFSAALAFVHSFGTGAALKITPSVKINPNQFDEDDRSSTASLTVDLRRPTEVTHYVGATPQDQITPFASYTLASTFEGEFDDRRGTSHTVDAGVTYEDVRTYACLIGESAALARINTPGCSAGFLYRVTGAYQAVRSSDPSEELDGPLVKVAFLMPKWRGLGLNLEGGWREQSFESAVGSNGAAREDRRLQVTISVDFSELIRQALPALPDTLSASLGFRYTENSSNAPASEYQRRHVVPSIAWKREF